MEESTINNDYSIIYLKNTEVLVSNEDYLELNSIKWRLLNKYIQGDIESCLWSMHRYIIIKILKNDINSEIMVDHINNNKFDNRRCNLRLSNHSENSRNRIKKSGCLSSYIGVTYDKSYKKWKTHLSISKTKTISAFYDNEHWAAYHYNILCKELKYNTAKVNIISDDKLLGFKRHYKQISTNPGKNINLTKCNKFEVKIKKIHIGNYDSLEEAELVRDLKIKELNQIYIDNINKSPIKYNNDGECIIEIFSKKIKICEVIVDEELYYDLLKIKWRYNKNYLFNKKYGQLHRYILNYKGDGIVDHIDRNPLNNKKNNLRICTKQQNNMNKSSKKNSLSKYVGVSYNKRNNKWVAYIKINNKQTQLGSFETELEAAAKRDEATKLHYKEYGNLNLS
jgi:hypothetical protein